MFSYFGGKRRIIHRYPRPQYTTIIEPFCGAAAYACKFYDHDIWINDIYKDIITIWKWIAQASRSDIRGLPELPRGAKISDVKQLSQPERLLLRLLTNTGGASTNCDVVSEWAAGGYHKKEKRFRQHAVARAKQNFLQIAGKISHWKITHGSYDKLPDKEATWFVDPPYEQLGSKYIHNNKGIDYAALSKWCLKRRGQLIVCDTTEATWLPFIPLTLHGLKATLSKKACNEGVYHRCDKPIGLWNLMEGQR